MKDDKKFTPVQATIEESAGSFDRMLRKFIRRTKAEGIIQEYRESLRFDKPSVLRRKRKSLGNFRTKNVSDE